MPQCFSWQRCKIRPHILLFLYVNLELNTTTTRFIHGYLALYQTFKALLNNPLKALARKLYARGAVTECPHCHHNIRTVEATGGKREGYSLLRAENYLDEPEAEAEAEASHGVIRLSDDSEVSQV